jgi:hypothetical protein
LVNHKIEKSSKDEQIVSAIEQFWEMKRVIIEPVTKNVQHDLIQPISRKGEEHSVPQSDQGLKNKFV